MEGLLRRYLFERDVCDRHDSTAVRFLTSEIAKEVFHALEQSGSGVMATVGAAESDVVRRCRELLESQLFEPATLAGLAKHCCTSESTLLRAFKRELRVTPITYLRERRLDEARILLQTGRYSVSEVATRIGYARIAAFSVAFARKFGEPPSKVKQLAGHRPSRATRERPPAPEANENRISLAPPRPIAVAG